MNLNSLKEEYNYWINRNKAAEEYFATNSVANCMKYLALFNKISYNLSILLNEINKHYSMTKEGNNSQ
ncbi:MAG: hypothetical protein ACRC7N_01465 [Clostridium sp.]